MNTDQILEERGKVHGDFAARARICCALKRIVHDAMPGDTHPVILEGLDMVLHKISRIAAGDPTHPDHWQDISGYAELVVRHLRKKEPTTTYTTNP